MLDFLVIQIKHSGQRICLNKMRKFCSLLFLLVAIVESYCYDCNHLMFQDIDGKQGRVDFLSESIEDLHKDMWEKERELKEYLPETTNIVFGKLCLFNLSSHNKTEIPLVKLSRSDAGSSQKLFDSGTKRDDIESCLNGKDVDFDMSLIEISDISLGTQNNFPKCKESYDIGKDEVNRPIDPIKLRRQMIPEVLKIREDVEEKRIKHDQSRKKIEKMIEVGNKRIDALFKEAIDDLKAYQAAVNRYYKEISPLVIRVWHSEPRLLFFLKKYLKPGIFSTARLGFIPDIITLHLHSTQECCDCCRLQLVGSVYNWLYETALFSIGQKNENLLFHIIVTWFDVFPGNYKNRIRKSSIDINEFATIDDASPNPNSFTNPQQKFFVTFVSLDSAIYRRPTVAASD